MITQISLDYPKELRSIITIHYKEIDWTEEEINILVISTQRYWSKRSWSNSGPTREHGDLYWNEYKKRG